MSTGGATWRGRRSVSARVESPGPVDAGPGCVACPSETTAAGTHQTRTPLRCHRAPSGWPESARVPGPVADDEGACPAVSRGSGLWRQGMRSRAGDVGAGGAPCLVVRRLDELWFHVERAGPTASEVREVGSACTARGERSDSRCARGGQRGRRGVDPRERSAGGVPSGRAADGPSRRRAGTRRRREVGARVRAGPGPSATRRRHHGSARRPHVASRSRDVSSWRSSPAARFRAWAIG